MSRWLGLVLFLALGVALGWAYGYYIAPVQYVDTTPASMRVDYRTDYVLMVAERFSTQHDADVARRQLSLLGGDSVADVSMQALDFARSVSYAPSDLALLEDLNRAMQSVPSAENGVSPP